MATLPGLNKGVTKDPDPPATDTEISPITIPDGTTLVTTKTTNETIDNVDELIDYVSGDNSPNFIPQLAIENLVSDLALKEDAANKGAVSGYAGLDSSQELLLANFPIGNALEVLRRNAANDGLEFAVDSGEFFGPWTADHDAGGFNLINFGFLESSDANPASTGEIRLGNNEQITWRDAANFANVVLSVNTADQFFFTNEILEPTLLLPFIVDFVNAQHDHEAAAGGGQLVATLALTATGTKDSTTFLRGDDTWAVPPVGEFFGPWTADHDAGGFNLTNFGSLIQGNTPAADGAIRLGNFQLISWRNAANIADVVFSVNTSDQFIFTQEILTPTLISPVIVDFVNAQHDHEDGAGGGQLDSTLALSDTANIAYLNTTNAYIAGNRQDFLGLLAGTAGLNVGGVAGNPTTQVDGDVWLNTSTNQLFGRINGANVDLGAAGAGAPPFADTTSIIEGSVDPTKEMRFEVDGLTSGTTRVVTIPDADVTLVSTSDGLIANVNVAAAAAIATTKLADSANFVLSNQTNTFGDFAQIFADNQLFIQNPAATFTYQISAAGIAANRTITLPLLTGNDIFVTEAFAQTLTNKTISLTNNTLTGTKAEFDTAVTDDNFAYLATAQTFSTLQSFSASIDVVGSDIDNIQNLIQDLSTSGTDVDFGEDMLQEISISANTTFTGTGYAIGKSKILKITTDGTLRTLDFPAGWIFVGPKPADQAASKVGILSLVSFTAAEAGVVAVYNVED